MTFEFDGEKYKKASSHQKEWGVKLISELKFNGDECILDLGCGDGAITAQLADCVPNGYVIGIDASQGMINAAKKNHKADNLKFELIDIDAIIYQSKFDIIISNATLHWVKDHKKLITNVYTALKSNGVARFNFAAAGNCSNFFKIIKKAMEQPKYEKYFKSFIWPWYMPSIEEYKALVEKDSFSEIKVWEENADRDFPNADAMTRWIDQPSIVPFLECVNEEDARGFRNAVVKQMIKATSQPDGTYFETFRRINLLVKKM